MHDIKTNGISVGLLMDFVYLCVHFVEYNSLKVVLATLTVNDGRAI